MAITDILTRLTHTKAVKRLFYGLAFSSLSLLGGCGLFLSSPVPWTAAETPRQLELESVPFFSQGDDLCGPASLSMVMNYRGQELTPSILEPLIYIPDKKGALQVEMLAAARRFDLIPYILEPRLMPLIDEIQAGNPVLILQNLGFNWLPKWHYAVVIGYDLDRDLLILRSGNNRRLEMNRDRFMRHWRGSDGWAMVALPAGQLPATARELPYLEGVASLERLNKWQTVGQAYEASIKQWPGSFFAHLGAGTAYYHQGNHVRARDYYRKAVELNPGSAVAHNNLAQILFEIGNYREARQYARKAVELGGTSTPAYRQTLDQIEAMINR